MRVVFACVIAAAWVGLANGQTSEPAKWAAAVKANEAAYSPSTRLAFSKIDAATYVSPGKRAWLRPTGEANGKLAWMDTPGRDALLEVAATNNTVTVRLRGEAIAFRRDTISILSISDDVDLQFFPVQLRDRVWAANVFAYNQANPAASTFGGLNYYAYDPAYRVEAAFEPVVPTRVNLLTSSGISKTLWKLGAARFTLKGATLTLPLYGESVTGPAMFAFFVDATSGTSTHRAGRHLDVESVEQFPPKTVTLDFNYARNPVCARAAFYNCPSNGDQLTAAVEAGEKAVLGLR